MRQSCLKPCFRPRVSAYRYAITLATCLLAITIPLHGMPTASAQDLVETGTLDSSAGGADASGVGAVGNSVGGLFDTINGALNAPAAGAPGFPVGVSFDDRPIMQFSAAQQEASGSNGDWQAHPIVELRHMQAWDQAAGMSSAQIAQDVGNAPAVLLTAQEETDVAGQLCTLLPCDGSVYSKAQVWDAYQTAYADMPNWLDAVRPYFS